MIKNNKTIIYVDDNPDDISLLKEMLQDCGFNIIGLEAGRFVHKAIAQQKPDMLITDIALPDMSGGQIVDQVKSAYPDLPIIVVTGIMPEQLAMMTELGADGAYSKDEFFQPETLLNRLKPFLGDCDSK